MRHHSAVVLSLAIVLLLTTVVAGYQRTSALACSTEAFEAWGAGGTHGTRACLVYLALGPDVGATGAAEPSPRTTPAPTPTSSAPASTPAPAPTPPSPAAEVASQAGPDGPVEEHAPSFHSPGEAQMYDLLLQDDLASYD